MWKNERGVIDSNPFVEKCQMGEKRGWGSEVMVGLIRGMEWINWGNKKIFRGLWGTANLITNNWPRKIGGNKKSLNGSPVLNGIFNPSTYIPSNSGILHVQNKWLSITISMKHPIVNDFWGLRIGWYAKTRSLHPLPATLQPNAKSGSGHALNLHDLLRLFGGRVSANRRIYREQRF